MAVAETPIRTMAGWNWTNCGLESDVVQVYDIQVQPDPPEPGKDLTITANGLVRETIEEGAYANVVVKIGLIKLLQKTFDVCEEARNANATIQCPVKEDNYTLIQTVHLPKEIPRGKFVVDVRAFTVDDRDMMCLNLKVDFMKSPFFSGLF